MLQQSTISQPLLQTDCYKLMRYPLKNDKVLLKYPLKNDKNTSKNPLKNDNEML